MNESFLDTMALLVHDLEKIQKIRAERDELQALLSDKEYELMESLATVQKTLSNLQKLPPPDYLNY